MPNLSFNPAADVPDVSGKSIFITGGTAGLGASTALQLAQKKASRIYISGRNAQSATTVINQVQKAHPDTTITFIPCDLSNLSSVQSAAQNFLAQQPTLDILICNAGIMATPPGTSANGYEIQFATNHLGHALLINLLLPLLRSSTPTPRIILLTSVGYIFHPLNGIDFPTLTSPQETRLMGPWVRYGQSKLANILYARELATRYPDVVSVAVHPGIVSTELIHSLSPGNKAFIYATTFGRFLDAEQGAWNSVWAAAVEKEELVSGGFYVPVGKKERLRRCAEDGELAGRLWTWTEEALKGYL